MRHQAALAGRNWHYAALRSREYHAENFLGFVRLGCICILLLQF